MTRLRDETMEGKSGEIGVHRVRIENKMKNALELLRELCRWEFRERKAEAAAALLSKDVRVIGTSDARLIQSRAQALAYLKREVAQMAGPCQVNLSEESLTMMGENASVACAHIALESDDVAVAMRVSASAGVEDGDFSLFLMIVLEC